MGAGLIGIGGYEEWQWQVAVAVMGLVIYYNNKYINY